MADPDPDLLAGCRGAARGAGIRALRERDGSGGHCRVRCPGGGRGRDRRRDLARARVGGRRARRARDPAGRGGAAGGLLARFASADGFRERDGDDRAVDRGPRAGLPPRVQPRSRSTRPALNAPRFAASILSLCCALGLPACWRAPLRGIDFGPEHDPYRSKGHIEPEEIRREPVYRLLLFGDGGEPGAKDPTLALLGEWGNAHPARTTAVFLGDNLYPSGLAFEGRARARGEAILLQQIEATRAR